MRVFRARSLSACSRENATSARYFKGLWPADRRKIAKTDRTFGCRRRPISIGGFQRPIPNGRRQAMIFRLRGVALSWDQFVAYQPNGNGRNGQTIWLSLAALGSCWTDILMGGTGGVDRTAKLSNGHCKFILVAPIPSIFSKMSVQNRFTPKRRAHSQITHAF
ncbi:hypothetical protein ACU4GH_11580 [Bradyrhizobium betae]